MTLLPVLILLLAIFGGTQFFLLPAVIAVSAVATVGLLAAVAVLRPEPSPWVLPLSVLSGSAALAMMGTQVTWWAASRLWLYGVVLLVILLVQIDPEELRRSIYLAGWLWPALWLLGPDDNRNIVAVWPVLFILAAIPARSGWSWWHIVIHLVILSWLGSRGAAVGLLAGLAVYYLDWRRRGWWVGLGVALVSVGLVWVRPDTALYRLDYWRLALFAIADNPIFGVGPGGIRDLGLIVVDAGVYQPHAHNFLLTWLTETGLVGLAGLGVAGWLIYRLPLAWERWQLAIIAALFTHSMVDDPLWWPGPLMTFALLLTSVRERDEYRTIDNYHPVERTRRSQSFVAGPEGGE